MFAAIFRYLIRLRRPVGLGLSAVVPTLALGGLYCYESFAAKPWEIILRRGEATTGIYLRKHGQSTAARPDMIFLGVDDASLQLDGLWPDEIDGSPALKLIRQSKGAWNWSREVHGRLLDRLADAGARLVIFDMTFPNPNDGDEAFRAALDRHRDRVVIMSQFVGSPPHGSYQTPANTLLADPLQDPRVGYATYLPDFDGAIKQTTFRMSLLDYNNHPPVPGEVAYPSLVASALRQLGRGDLIPADGQPRLFRYTAKPLRRNKDDDSADYAPRPLWEVFSDAAWQSNYGGGAFFKDKIVIVGAAAPTLHDFQPTPYGEIPGPSLHLQALTAALKQDYLRPTTLVTNLALLLGAGAFAWMLGLTIRQPLVRLAALAALTVLYVAVLQRLFDRFGLLPLAFTPLLVFNSGGLAGLIGEYAVERAEKARVRGVLDRLVSKDIVRELLENRESYEELVRGVRRPVTVLFSDVRGFTTLSEAADDPRAFIAQLNEYLGEMVDVVFKHKGTLDKFIGDAVMAVWGSMHTDGIDADACKAVAAALEMRTRLAALNEKWSREGKLPLDIGIGLNHGDAMVGGLGSEDSKMEITVIGDAVNLASRLESLTKEYGLGMLVGESVARIVSESYRLRTVDLVRVKGKKKPSEVMTVLGPLTDVPSEAQEFLWADYEDAILLYRRQEFTAAAQLLEECLKIDPADRLVALYLERCRELLAAAPAADWDGVKLMTTK